jgi:exonuclease-1
MNQLAHSFYSSDIEPSLAKMVALGNADPVTLLPMEDINPTYIPRAVKALPLVSDSINRSKDVGNGKAPDKPPNGILNFFGTFPFPQLYITVTTR